MRPHRIALAAGLVSAVALALLNAPTASATNATAATADPAPGSLTFYTEPDLTGTEAVYPGGPSDTCTELPFVVHGHLNLSQRGFTVYESTDCSGHGLTFPANDLHSYQNHEMRSFRATG
ncbi:hypothetical protein [Streptomyces sp. SBT349]|uniref:hypothetical protein n=1 Tax=Streptomyces sp. SBT349 TaxID=1580539 RepID=UPI00066AE025|nr:hypothetical protein [Streptomyces sp. SBT349]